LEFQDGAALPEGFHAGLVFFDPETVRDAATLEQP
jgi:hypothetical protein